MRRHVDRELARARTRGGDLIRSGVVTAVAPLVRSLISTVTRTDVGHHIKYEMMIADDVIVPLDRTDLAEVSGKSARKRGAPCKVAGSRHCLRVAGPDDDQRRGRWPRDCTGIALDRIGARLLGSMNVEAAPESVSPSCRTCSTPTAGLWTLQSPNSEALRPHFTQGTIDVPKADIGVIFTRACDPA